MPNENILHAASDADPELMINTIQIKKAFLSFRAIHHDLRQKMIHLIHTKEKVIVTDLYKSLGLEQSVASQHLAILRRAGFVSTTRAGKHIYYRINYEHLKTIQKLSSNLFK